MLDRDGARGHPHDDAPDDPSGARQPSTPEPEAALFDVPEGARRPRHRVVLLTGPSGSGKSSMVRRLGVPSVPLDDFYLDIDTPGLPQRYGSVDWDSPLTWDRAGAVATLVELCRDGEAVLPLYDIPTSRRTGETRLVLEHAPIVVAEGIFASEIVEDLRGHGILADAICLVQPRLTTFWFRLLRDFAEARKPAGTLVRRGTALMRSEPAMVRRWVAAGCRPLSPASASHRIRALVEGGVRKDGSHG